ncbi:MAG: helix-turn-helix transcriptional regulator [Desulfuromonadales bacterium]|nr:helix-turn-helix transcriptional regulator [Desulfuromonadales bacterium]
MNKQPDNAKYLNTKELVVRATDDGLTQKEIAKLCKVHQSVVSGWKTGIITARWKKINPLIEKYGDIQGGNESIVYCRISNATYKFDENSVNYLKRVTRSLLLHEMKLSEKKDVSEGVSKIIETRRSTLENITSSIEKNPINFETIDDVYAYLSSFKNQYDDDLFYSLILPKDLQSGLLESAHRYDKKYVKVSGEMIFDYSFSAPHKSFDDEFSWMKWSIIASDKNSKFTWIISKKKHIRDSVKVDPTHEHATWLSEIYEELDAETIIESAKKYKVDPLYDDYVDRDVLLFSLVHAFTQNGYALKCVSTIP